MPKFIDRVGEIFISNQGETIRILEYFNNKNCTIIFNEKHIVHSKNYNDIKNGNVRNPNFPSVYSIGFIGIGFYKAFEKDKKSKAYTIWRSMFSRCYDEKFKERKSTYKGCVVTEEWHNFQNFATWFEENYNPKIMQGWSLDKDILVKGNKIYSPETCCFVTQQINLLFVKMDAKRGNLPIGVRKDKNKYSSRVRIEGKNATHLGSYNTIEEAFQAYKTAKETYIKEVADKWKDKIGTRVYQAMYDYQVEITD